MSEASDRSAVLARVPLFADLGPAERTRLAGLAREQSLERGEVLCKEGEPGETFYLVERGELEVRVASEGDRVVRRLGPGDFLGEIALLLGGARTASVTASRSTRLLTLSKEEFQSLFGSNPTVIATVSRVLAQRMAASSRGRGAERAYHAIAVFGAPGVRGKTMVAELLAALLHEYSGEEVLLVGLRPESHASGRGTRPLRLSEAAEGGRGTRPLRLSEAAEGERAIETHVDEDLGGVRRLVLSTEDSVDATKLAAAADAIAWKVSSKSPIVLFDLADAGRSLSDAVARFADVAVEVSRTLDVEALTPSSEHLRHSVRHYVVLNQWHDDAPSPEICNAEPFVLPVDLALVDADTRERVRVVLEELRSPASPPLRRLARKILGTSVGLALGGGAAFGIAHVGVLRSLERHGIPVDLIAGTSMGSIVSLGYAGGLSPEEMYEIALRIGNKRTTLSALDFNFLQPGLLAGDRLVEIFAPLLGSVKRFEQLRFPCQTVAADIESGERVCLSTGLLTDAFRASCSVPMLWTPVRRGDRVLVDGGMVDPVPAEVAREMGADLVIGVNVVPQLRRGVETSLSRWYRMAQGWNPLAQVGESDLPSTFDTVMNTIQVLQHELGKFKAISADLRIDPDLSDFTWIEFYRPKELIERGEEAVERAIPAIEELLSNRLQARALH